MHTHIHTHTCTHLTTHTNTNTHSGEVREGKGKYKILSGMQERHQGGAVLSSLMVMVNTHSLTCTHT